MAPTDEYEYSFDRIYGYFEAPISGTYQFHQSCNDRCQFYMNTAGMDPAGKAELMDRSADTNFRSYGFHNYNDAHIGSVFSDWISLTEGEKYYVEQHVENDADNGHATVGFEV